MIKYLMIRLSVILSLTFHCKVDTLAGGVDHPVLVVGLPAGERLQQLHLLPDRQLIDDGQILQPSWNTSGIGVRRQRSKHVINCAKGVKEEVLSNKIVRNKNKIPERSPGGVGGREWPVELGGSTWLVTCKSVKGFSASG